MAGAANQSAPTLDQPPECPSRKEERQYLNYMVLAASARQGSTEESDTDDPSSTIGAHKHGVAARPEEPKTKISHF